METTIRHNFMQFIKRSGESKRNGWPAPMAPRYTGSWNKENSSFQLQHWPSSSLWPRWPLTAENSTGCGSCQQAAGTKSQQIVSVWEQISAGIKRRLTVLEKGWKNDNEHYYPRSDLSGQRNLNSLVQSWQSFSLLGRRKEKLFYPLRRWKS